MALAIAQGGGAAAASGVNFRDFSAAIAAIAPLFSSGSDAGTSFKTFLQRLVPDTKSATEAFIELGLITADGSNKFFDASGKMKSMAEIAGILNESLNKLSDKDRTRLLANAFGTDAMRTAIGLSRMTREEFEALQTAMGEASAAEIGAQRMKGFSGAMEQLKGAIETARIEIGDRLNPVATALAQRLAELVPILKDRLLAAMDWFGREVVPRVQEALAQLRSAWERIEEPVMRFLRSKEALNIGLGLLAAVLMSVAVAAGAAAAGMIAAVAPVAAIGLAIGGLLIVADKLGVDWGVVWERVKAVVSQAADWIRTAIEGIASVVGMVREHWGQISGAVSEAFGAVRGAVESVLGPVLSWLREQVAWLRGWWQENWDEIRTVATAVWGGIRAAVETAVQTIGQIVEGVVRFLVGAWRAVGDDILANVRATWQLIGAAVEFAIRNLMLTIQLVLNLITGDWRGAWDTIKQMFQNFLDFLRSAGSALLDIGKSVLTGFRDGLVAVWDNLIWPWLSGLGSKIVDQFKGMVGRMTDAGRDLIQGLWDGAKSVWESVLGWAGGWMGEFLGAVGDMANWLVDKAEKMMSEFWERQKRGWGRILGWVSGLMDEFLRAFGDGANWLVDIGRKIIDGLWRGLKEKWEDVSGWLSGLGDKIKSLKGPPEKDRVLLYQIGEMIMAGLGEGMFEGWEKDVVKRIAEIGRGLIRNYQEVAEQAKAAGIPDWRNLGEVLTQALADGLFDRFKKNKPLLEQVAKELIALAEDTSKKVSDAVGKAGDAIAGAGSTGGEVVKAEPAPPPPPTGAHGRPLVWVESLRAWVEEWMAPGLQGMSPAEWARSMTPQPWGGPAPSAQPVQVSIEIDGRQVARAILPDILSEAERQGVSL
jgi:phage-related protein